LGKTPSGAVKAAAADALALVGGVRKQRHVPSALQCDGEAALGAGRRSR